MSTPLFRGILNGKRVQANLGAKNHAVIMPDGIATSIADDLTTDCSVANKNLALNSIVGAAFGGALN
jgi:malonate-semialdehyde dehydrogenase (acetylating)/methylmalonate-semialdehyde dehydrogenase